MELEISSKFKDEIQSKLKETHIGNIIVTPPINEDYWLFRVKLHKDQAILGFPKFFTIGIGFALEDDWNTNLPYPSEAEHICDHIWHNKKYKEITREQVIKAIKMIQKASAEMEKIK